MKSITTVELRTVVRDLENAGIAGKMKDVIFCNWMVGPLPMQPVTISSVLSHANFIPSENNEKIGILQ